MVKSSLTYIQEVGKILKKISVKLLALFFVLYFTGSAVFAVTSASAAGKTDTGEVVSVVLDKSAKKDSTPKITISSEQLSVKKGKTIQLTAVVSGVDKLPKVTWTSSDEKIATVDENGLVKGRAAGKAIITASAKIDKKTVSADFALNVVTSTNFIKDYLLDQQVLSYQYSYIDDYYYTNDKDAWQYNFGYGPIYDIAAPYILLEYDYVRVFFEHEGKDWMIQLWKGQYGLIFYGGEIGIYNKPHSDNPDNLFTFYNCPPEEDWIKMEVSLYHQQLNGSWKREFTRPYGDYWWCTGFKDGHLRVEEPADELRIVGRLTLKDKKMAKLFAQGLLDCGFKQVSKKDDVKIDSFYIKGSDVYLQWQDINEAENTMPVKVLGGFLIASKIIRTLMLFPILGFAAILVP